MSRLAPLALLLVAAGCFYRDKCQTDSDCQPGLVCYPDFRCLPRDVAKRAGATVGSECTDDSVCRAPGYCMTGWCTGEPPLGDVLPPGFSGIKGVEPDGDGALLVYWDLPNDETTAGQRLDVLVWRSESPEVAVNTTPVGTVRGVAYFRDSGLTAGTTYYYRARARDEALNQDDNVIVMSASAMNDPVVAPGVDYATQVQTVFNARCTKCHSPDAGKPAGLSLVDLAGVLTGGIHGPAVVACDVANSNLAGKISDTPPFGVRMPHDGPPYLPRLDVARIRRWISDGARMTYDANACERTAPAFAGIQTLTVTSPTSCRAGWSAGSDDVTPASALRYRAYVAQVAGAQSFAMPAAESAPGALSVDITGLPTLTQAWVVVRAVDAAGNQDSNRWELPCTPQ